MCCQEEREAGNAYVVPYNPWLLYMFDSHINVEMCSTVKACKYIFKYIFKVRRVALDTVILQFVQLSELTLYFYRASIRPLSSSSSALE